MLTVSRGGATHAIIHRIGNASFGTDNDEILDTIISLANNPSLIIVIRWPPGSDPSSEVLICQSSPQQQSLIRLRN